MPQQPPKIYRHRRLVEFTATVTYKGEVWLNDCDDSQIDSRIGEAIAEYIAEDPLSSEGITHEILSVSNEDLTSNDYPQ